MFQYDKQTFYTSQVRISKCKRCYNIKPSAYYFCVKTQISINSHICINVPLIFCSVIYMGMEWFQKSKGSTIYYVGIFFSEKLKFLTCCYAHIRVSIIGVRNVRFLENLAYVLIESSIRAIPRESLKIVCLHENT